MEVLGTLGSSVRQWFLAKKTACHLLLDGDTLLQVEEFKYCGALFTSDRKMERNIDRRIVAAPAVMQSLYLSVIVKKADHLIDQLDLRVELR